MKLDEYKDLRKGDLVRYDNVRVHDNLTVSGEGRIFGFGEFDHNAIIWVSKEEGGVRGVPYENITKSAPPGVSQAAS